ncbi:endolytic transglycosylase MltG [Arthrobacter sp. Soil763]|uniref:endolytic transglycosylase MltG n=1 Tax=Arthrobacter sp. Soil763 TaxID=1736402 RepID=UPI0006FD89D5|nr:endolytic transglycosylase MltG [Arthrobacter sp. Soil763]KRE78417.1 aminodeoxychorismate lyase [Arthrobacter sp. Soil763]
MSPVNHDDSSGVADDGAGRPLTRKEIRAREKSLATQGHDVIPPQAFETGQDAPPAAAPGSGPAETSAAAPAPETPAAAPAPEPPAAAPTVHEPVRDEPAREEPVQEEPVREASAPRQPAAEPVEAAPVEAEPVHEYAPAMSREETLRRADELQYGHSLGHGHDGQPYDEQSYDEQPYDSHGYEGQGHEDHADAADGYDHAGDHGHGQGHDLMVGAAAIPTAKGPSKKVRRRRRFLALVVTLAVFVVAIAVGAQFIKPLLGGNTKADYPGPGTGSVTITVPPGAGPSSVATDMESKNVIANADSFLKQFAASGGSLSPGTFTLRKEMNNADAVAALLNADQEKVMYFALSAGLRINESLQAISEGTGIPVADLKELSNNPKQFGVPAEAKNLEGFLFPGEYRFPLGSSGKDILQKLVRTTLDELKAQGVTDPAKQYDAITVASIVQAEGGQAEYGDVAGAIYNRLKPSNTETNGLIQSDATVTYGLGIRSFHIDEDQKADKSNKYNTYANVGLPVGPIGSPGKRAIDAAAKPKKNDYLYWVTINLDTKETKFSKTLAEHNGYVAKYNAWCEANPGRCV